MANILEKRCIEVEAGHGSLQELLVGLRGLQTALKNGLKSSVRAVLPGAHRESSTWLALRAEYGPNEPITEAFDSDIRRVQMRHYVDH